MAKDKSRDALRAVGDAVEQDKPGARPVGWAAVVQCTAGEQPYPQLLKVSWLPSLHCEHLEGGAEPGLFQICSTPLHAGAKALDDAPFSGDGEGGWMGCAAENQ